MERSIPSVLGYTETWDNIGETANKGVDLTLNSVNVQTSNFSWSTSLIFSASKDRIVSLTNGDNDDISNKWFIGERLNVYYDYEKLGIWQNTSEDQLEMAKFNENGGDFGWSFGSGRTIYL